ncbi:MAG: cytochrome bc complex cytochrome b subunit [Bacteroidetes bacterium]|nr:cytochrome bc complex cytochrome b subunit [Bacteroidota bacterium]
MGLAKWFQTSFPFDSEELAKMSSEPIPNHLKKWWFALGGTPLYMFVVQLITGFLLVFYYVPNPELAYDSVAHITETVPFGWMVRSIHKWSANIMVAAVILHMMRVFFTRAYRQPRELNWMFGVCLFLLTLMFGFTGYSLIYEQMSYWAMQVGTEIAGATPLIGEWLASFLKGGDDIGQNTLTRFHTIHVILLPVAMMFLVALHIYLIRTIGVGGHHFHGKEEIKKKTFPFWPDHAMTELIMVSLIMFVLLALALMFPAHLGEPANPNVTPLHIKPEWYFYPVFRWLKITNLTWGVLGPMIFLAILLFWPFIDRFFEKLFPKKDVAFWIGVVGAITLTVFLFWETIGH